LWQGSQRPGGYHIESLWRQVFQPGIPDRYLQVNAVGGSLKKCAFFRGGLMQGHGQIGPQQGQHQPWKAGARTEVGQGPGLRRNEGRQLGRVPEMPVPKVGQGAFRH